MVYKFPHSGHPRYISAHLSVCCGRYGTKYNHADKRFLNITHLYTNLKKHFGHTFAFDAPTVWNDLPDDVLSAPTLFFFFFFFFYSPLNFTYTCIVQK